MKDTLPRFLSHFLPSRFISAYGFFDSLVLIVLLVFVSALVFCLIGGYSLTWVLALTFVALPYACYLYLIPICYSFTRRLFFPKHSKSEVTVP